MTEVPLRRNRDFVLFQIGQLLSDAGTQSTSIAYPLLVLALTHSAAKAGAVSFVRTMPLALFALPAGVVADRWHRKRLMVAADGVRVLAVGALAATILLHDVTVGLLLAIGFVEGTGAAVFSAAQSSAIRSVVAPRQLPAAIATQTGRQAAVMVTGPPLGGALFAIARSVPFVADAASYVFSTVAVLLIRSPFQQPREPDVASVRTQLTEGIRYLWDRPFLRTSSLLLSVANFIIPGLLLALVVLATRDGLSGGEVGLMVALFGVCVLVGSALSPVVRRLLPVRGVVLLELWTYVCCAAFLIWPSVYVLAGTLVPTGLAIASTDSVVHGYRIAMTPDRLLGRVESVRSAISLAIAPIGPLLAGALLAVTSPRATIAVFAVSGLVLAVWGTLSPAIRAAPRLDDIL